ncbi:NUDIX domain-containing protein [Erythrobacter rubeus]|uniref:NUDIX domain-containing protein n=1 Tax=Erythrobacter rubeus TaxID=2760803 RepID=A0ABR8KNZ2_9SPHN|nr:NUDIX domain-containing protein [Erythrobacter rubeus]MBD2840868.1 NUDIX domain-containing protein [Erythrobacter rubeus]
MLGLIPAPIHRAIMPIAHRLRHRWRRFLGRPIAGVSVVVTNLQGDVLLLRHSYGPKVWALPGGGLKRGEDPQECARREVREELGIELKALHEVARLHEVLSGSPHTAYILTATCNVQPKPDRREVVEARYFPSHSLPEPLGELTKARIAAWKKRGTASP